MNSSVSSSDVFQNLYARVLQVREGDLANLGTLIEYVEGIPEGPHSQDFAEIRELMNRLVVSDGKAFQDVHGELKQALERKSPPAPGAGDGEGAEPGLPAAPPAEGTLYEKLGGASAIKAAVETFYERVLGDGLLAPVFAGVDMGGLRRHQALFLSQALGGPKQYEGRELAEVHAPLKITREQFDRVAGHLRDSLVSLGVGATETDQVLAVVAPLRDQITGITGSAPGDGPSPGGQPPEPLVPAAAGTPAGAAQAGVVAPMEVAARMEVAAPEAAEPTARSQPQPAPPPLPQPDLAAADGIADGIADNGVGVDAEMFMEFVEESLTHLQSIELNILTLESEPGNLAVVNNIFRPFHTIKGVAGFLGLKEIHRLCHDLENLLDHARKGRLEIIGGNSDLILQAVDLLKELISACRLPNQSQIMAENAGRVDNFLARIAAAGKGRRQTEQVAPAGPEKLLGEIMVEQQVITPEKLDQAIESQKSGGGPLGTILIQEHGVKTVQVAHALREQHASKVTAVEPGPGTAEMPGVSSDSIRVRITLLDQLMNLVGELVLGRNQLLQKLGNLGDDVQGLNSILHDVDRVTSEVQEAVMQTRMQPLGGLFSRFHRVIRDLARSMNKKIDFNVTGETVELDKTLIEALGDPLTHLIRNCADHGIESPQVRAAAGKSEAGTISLSAYHEGGKVHVKVSDDGAGVDLNRVKEKAIENALLTREEAGQMSERETLRLLFAPGFSTATTITGVSGRGVGMDVVLSNIEKIGGTVEITSEPGSGTTFLLDLPLTLAIVPALIVSAGEQRFAIPQTNLLELVHLEGADALGAIMEVRGAEVYNLRGAMLPLLRLGRVLAMKDGLGETTAPTRAAISIVVMAVGNHQIGLIVDRIFDTEEIVVKPLNNLLKDLGVYAGATLMGDGRPALILDMAGLVRAAELTVDDEGGPEDFQRQSGEETRDGAENQTILLFKVHPEQQLAVPLTLISRLETVKTAAIQTSINGKVVPYGDGLLPLVFLEDHVSITPPPERETVKVLVFEIEHTVGLVVTEIIDSLEVPVNLDDTSMVQKGFSGLALVNANPTAFVDIYQVIEMAFPQWFKHDRDRRKETLDPSQTTLLLAEDSNFYRNVEKNYLLQEGFKVLEAADGAQAFDLLLNNPVDLVVTDIEMPEMNGFELAEKIRATEQLRHLPIIAVTSLSHEDERQRGIRAGLNSYLVKLKKGELMQEVHRLLTEQRKFN